MILHQLADLLFHFLLNIAFSHLWVISGAETMSFQQRLIFILCEVFLQYFIIAETIDYLAEHFYTKIPYLNNDKRPQKERPGKQEGYIIYFMRWTIPIFCASILLFLETIYTSATREYSLSYFIWLGIVVQLSLIFADLLYGAWHHLQHTYKWLYYGTHHDYHHLFKYPYGREATWLGFIDLWVSSGLIGFCNILVTSLIMGKLNTFEIFLVISYVHEMNCCDHSGKVMPFHTGVPFFPFISSWLGFDKSVQAHEAHHNYGKYSYGLIGLYDRIMGTAKYAQ
jgi:sterol desaturase/sphingolipid hydroxylase (fatty acid hydroxylase superfamily)